MHVPLCSAMIPLIQTWWEFVKWLTTFKFALELALQHSWNRRCRNLETIVLSIMIVISTLYFHTHSAQIATPIESFFGSSRILSLFSSSYCWTQTRMQQAYEECKQTPRWQMFLVPSFQLCVTTAQWQFSKQPEHSPKERDVTWVTHARNTHGPVMWYFSYFSDLSILRVARYICNRCKV